MPRIRVLGGDLAHRPGEPDGEPRASHVTNAAKGTRITATEARFHAPDAVTDVAGSELPCYAKTGNPRFVVASKPRCVK